MKQIETWLAQGVQLRATYLKRLFKGLTKLKLTATHLTFLRFFGGPLFVFLFVRGQYQSAFLFLLFISVLDWIDGGLARYQKKASDRGKFWDVLVDHLNYVIPMIALFSLPWINEYNLGFHLSIVPVTYLLAILVESEGRKTDWIIHPFYTIVYFKALAFFVFFLFAFFRIDVLNAMVFLLNIAMSVWSLYYVLVLTKRWKSFN